MKKVEVLKNDPWQNLAKGTPVKKVELNEVLKKLEVTESEAPQVKREMLSRVTKIIKPQG